LTTLIHGQPRVQRGPVEVRPQLDIFDPIGVPPPGQAPPDPPEVYYACVPDPWADHPDATPVIQAVLRAIVRECREEGLYSDRCAPTRARLCGLAKVSLSALVGALRWLKDKGAIEEIPDPTVQPRRWLRVLWRRAGTAEPARPGADASTAGRAPGARMRAPQTPMRAPGGRPSFKKNLGEGSQEKTLNVDAREEGGEPEIPPAVAAPGADPGPAATTPAPPPATPGEAEPLADPLRRAAVENVLNKIRSHGHEVAEGTDGEPAYRPTRPGVDPEPYPELVERLRRCWGLARQIIRERDSPAPAPPSRAVQAPPHDRPNPAHTAPESARIKIRDLIREADVSTDEALPIRFGDALADLFRDDNRGQSVATYASWIRAMWAGKWGKSPARLLEGLERACKPKRVAISPGAIMTAYVHPAEPGS
jgi:hypothetical protein